jgi:hypothetical protein
MSESKLIYRLNKLPPCETPHYAIALNPLLKRPELLAEIARACGGAAANLRSSKAREVAQAAGVPRGLHVRLGERCFDSVMATFLLWNDCDAARGYEPDHVCLSIRSREGRKQGSLCNVSHCHAIYATLREVWPKARIIWYGHEWRHNYHGHARKAVYPADIPCDDRTLDLYGSNRCTLTGWLLMSTKKRPSGKRGCTPATLSTARAIRSHLSPVGSRGWRCSVWIGIEAA